MIISQHKSLAELYSELCVRFREIHKMDQEGETTCKCGTRKSAHLSDGRCSSWAGSQTFNSVESEELAKIGRALDLIEELSQKINV